MRAQDLEPELEELLDRLIPNLSAELEGATLGELDAIQRIAGRELPRCYQWFLLRMGHRMGPLAYPSLDFSAPKVLECYAEELFRPFPRFLMIGYETGDMMPLHVLYDFDHPARDDARVIKRHARGGPVYNQFETLREMLAWGKISTLRIHQQPQRAIGTLVNRGGDVLSLLDPVMESLGFSSPVSTGPCCGLFMGEDVNMVTSTTPNDEGDTEHHVFHIGAPTAARIRRVLGEIVAETDLALQIKEWAPSVA